MDAIVKEYMESWRATGKPLMTDIPVAKADLQGRMAEDAGPFDGGKTAAWLVGLGTRATWRAVRDANTGHSIHVLSDRPFDDLTADLRLGLRLMAWMSARPITWYWWDQPWVREMPAGVDPSRDHLNGGWAVPGVLEVHVYRREEAHKVMLHESIHALGLDVPHAATIPVLAQFEASLGRKLWPHLGEAYTEFFAEFLWAIASGGGWDYQVRCAARQAAIVWARIRDATEPENTNVFAYYVLKWVLMGHQTESLIGPDHSVGKWFAWWLSARDRLDRAATVVADSEQRAIHMGMTCPYGLPG
jgi:hypothetical protein